MAELTPRFREDYVGIVQSFLSHQLKASGREGVVLGLSGGVDSTVVAKLCAEALGPRRVLALALPEGGGGRDLADARAWAKALDIGFRVIDIAPLVSSFDKHLGTKRADRIARGNLRARTRMVVLYWVANTENRLVIGTGNKSELLTGYFCYDSRTRVLTPDGPKHYWEVRQGTTVFSMNLSSRQVEEVPVEAVHVFDYDDELVEIRTERVNLLVTPNHRLLVARNHGSGSLGFDRVQTRMMGGAAQIPVPVPWAGTIAPPTFIDTSAFIDSTKLSWNVNPPARLPAVDFLYLMGLFIGDGHGDFRTAVDDVKSLMSQEERLAYRDQMGRLVTVPDTPGLTKEYVRPRIYIASGEGKRSRGPLLHLLARNGIRASSTPTLIAFTNRGLSAAFAQCGVGARNKRIPDWVLKYPASHLKHLYRGLMDSDGSRRGYTYYTTSEVLAYQVTELCAKLGLHAWVARRPARTSQYRGKAIRGGPGFEVRIGLVGRTITVGREHMKLVPYRGKVWCPSVPPHENVLVERDGRLLFCGNTKFGDGGADFLPIGDLYKTQVRAMARRLGVPERIVAKAPTAGLWPGQTDEGELGISYELLDRILLGIELQLEPEAIAEKARVRIGQVRRIEALVAATAFKRKMPLIPKVGVRTVGLDWRE